MITSSGTSASKYIVLTDNDNLERTLFRIIVNRLDPPVKFAEYQSGQELCAMLKASETLPDIVFLDVDMPGKNGIDCLIEIRSDERLSTLPVIMYSGNSDQRTIDAAYYNGANHYFIKPGDSTQLLAQLTWLIHKHHITGKHKRQTFVIDSHTEF
jgi:DNA-binding response OmpR family regulator